jgi:hypothetical protein
MVSGNFERRFYERLIFIEGISEQQAAIVLLLDDILHSSDCIMVWSKLQYRQRRFK